MNHLRRVVAGRAIGFCPRFAAARAVKLGLTDRLHVGFCVLPAMKVFAFRRHPRLAVLTWHDNLRTRTGLVASPRVAFLSRNGAFLVNPLPMQWKRPRAGLNLFDFVRFVAGAGSHVEAIGFRHADDA